MPSTPPVEWRLALCNLYGLPLALLGGIASDIEMEFLLNRPASLSFTVPSDSHLVNEIYGASGKPNLKVGNRIVKAYRRAPGGPPSSWDLKFVGRVWSLEDQGDGDTCKTAVNCFDPLQDLTKRLIRHNDGTYQTDVYFGGVTGALIIKRVIDRSNTHGAKATFIATTGSLEATATQTHTFSQAMIIPGIYDILDTGTVDLSLNYNDFVGDGTVWPTYMTIGFVERRGQDKPDMMVGYAGPPRNATGFRRTQSMDDFANDITLYAGSGKSSIREQSDDLTSINAYGAFEHAEVFSEIQNRVLLQNLLTLQMALRKNPRELVSFEPQPERAPDPFEEFHIGDSIIVNAGHDPNPEVRESVSGLQRVYGFSLAVGDDYGERVTSITVSADGS